MKFFIECKILLRFFKQKIQIIITGRQIAGKSCKPLYKYTRPF